MWSHLERGSSPVDWCESNYSISPVIAEFVNTILLAASQALFNFISIPWNLIYEHQVDWLFSNVIFFLFPPVLMHLFQEYSKFCNPAINILWILLMVVGLSSAYFHATLSLVGQLLDELAILWIVMAAFGMFLPKRYFPRSFNGNRRVLAIYVTIFSVVSTGLLVLHPFANAFALMTLAVPTMSILFRELNSAKCPRVYRLGLRAIAVFHLALACWILDRLFCEAWLSINFPYMHGLWHILIFITGYTSLVLCAYFNAIEEWPDQKPQLRYWPSNDFEWGVPYISIKKPYSQGHLASKVYALNTAC